MRFDWPLQETWGQGRMEQQTPPYFGAMKLPLTAFIYCEEPSESQTKSSPSTILADMNPAADFWRPAKQDGKAALNAGRSGNTNHQQKHQQQPYYKRVHDQYRQKKGYGNVKNWHYIHRDTFPSREQILANGRILHPGSSLELLTSIHPNTGECFAFLVSLSRVHQAEQPLATILYWGRGFSMDIAMIWLEYHVDWDLHRQLRGLAQVPNGFWSDVWGGLR